MSEKYTFALLGGDSRQAVVAKKLAMLGHRVKAYGLDSFAADISGVELFQSAERAIAECDAVILPLPSSRDGKTLNLTSADKKECPLLLDVVKYSAKCKHPLIIGGMIPYAIREVSKEMHVDVIDYYEVEALQRKNALPSAEGAIMVAMENTDRVIFGMRTLISGYGRIGKILADRLRKLGARVRVAARRDEVLCEIAMDGYSAVNIRDSEEMNKVIEDCEVIFNTVPSVIFTERVLSGRRSKPLYIEIASSPGGIDIPIARELGYRIIFAPSLPGRYAPMSAGEYIFETIHEILTERGINI